MFKVVQAGFFSTIQDAGRFGFRDIGVPVSGFMDAKAANIANSLLENDRGAAVLEITMTGPTLQFEEPTHIAVSGADMSASLNGQAISNYAVHSVEAGDILSFGKLKTGFRCYLAIKGGILSKTVLNSRSYFKTLTQVSSLKEEIEIPYDPSTGYQPKISHIKPEPIFKERALKVHPGPEFHQLSEKTKEELFNKIFTIAKEYNRMAYQLEEKIDPHKISMITSANLPGTVQLTPAGKLIILMRDGQTTGGYPRILQLTESSISLLAQKKFGDHISFVQL